MRERRCPYCGRVITSNAAKCPYCSEWLTHDISSIEANSINYQDFGKGKKYCISLLLLAIVDTILGAYLFIYHSGSFLLWGIFYLIIGFVAHYSQQIIRVISIYILNFVTTDKIFKNLHTIMKGINVLIFSFIAYNYLNLFIHSKIVYIITSICFFVIITSFLLLNIITGWRIAHIKNDYVGGLSTLGYTMCLATIFPPLWWALPILSYMLFSRAEKYGEENGWNDDE